MLHTPCQKGKVIVCVFKSVCMCMHVVCNVMLSDVPIDQSRIPVKQFVSSRTFFFVVLLLAQVSLFTDRLLNPEENVGEPGIQS